MASIKQTPMEVISLLDSEDEDEGRPGFGELASRGKGGKTKVSEEEDPASLSSP